MSSQDTESSLDRVYGAQGRDDVARHYDEWAKTYDAEMVSVGYRHPTICLALLARHVTPDAGPVLDAGAGTGMLGEWLSLIGYENIDALDISPGMLAVARSKGVYDGFHQAALGDRLDIESDRYAAVVSAGVFTTGHVGPEGFDELIRVTRPGGVIVVTVKEVLYAQSVRAYVEDREREGLWRRIDGTEPYVSMPGVPDTKPSRALVMRVGAVA